MGKIIGTTIFLGFSVDFLLLLEAGKAVGRQPGLLRALLGASLGGFWAGVSRMQGFGFLAAPAGQGVVLLAAAAAAFAGEEQGIRAGLLFVLLRFALEGMALGLQSRNAAVQLLLAAGLGAVCWWALGRRETVPVTVRYGNRSVRLWGLRDTGNLLRDPLTGEQVLVAGAELGQKLLDLTPEQLADPAALLAQGRAAGGRLIPYRSVGKPTGLLLALRMEEVQIGSRKGNALIAFSPTAFGNGYQLLLGGGSTWKN